MHLDFIHFIGSFFLASSHSVCCVCLFFLCFVFVLVSFLIDCKTFNLFVNWGEQYELIMCNEKKKRIKKTNLYWKLQSNRNLYFVLSRLTRRKNFTQHKQHHIIRYICLSMEVNSQLFGTSTTITRCYWYA